MVKLQNKRSLHSADIDHSSRLEHVNEGEKTLAKVHRHVFGLFIIYLQAIVAMALAFGLILPLIGDAFETLGLGRSAATGFSALLGLISIIFIMVYVVLASRIYWANMLIITNEHVTQVKQVGLFNQKVAEIPMGNVEDVSVHKKGIFQTYFNFGRLHIETAGEQNNYDFVYCPNPNAYAKTLQDARLEFIKTHGN